MQKPKQLLRELGLTPQLYLVICLVLMSLVLFQWPAPTVDLPVDGGYAYQYGISDPWLYIYKTADLGSLHLFEALTAEYDLGTGNWLIDPGPLLVDALVIFTVIGIVRWFWRSKQTNLC